MNISIDKRELSCFTCFWRSITQIICLTLSPTSLYNKIWLLSSAVMTRFIGTKHMPVGDNKLWLCSLMNFVTCLSSENMSLIGFNISRICMHSHLEDSLFLWLLESWIGFKGFFPARWQYKCYLMTLPCLVADRSFRTVKPFDSA